MGTPLPRDPPGTHCPACWGAGKPFFGEVTPRIMTMTFSGFTPGDFWNPADEDLLLAPHDLFQEPTPCLWFTTDAVFRWWVQWSFPFANARIQRLSDFAMAFLIFNATLCLQTYPSGLAAPANNVCYGGSVDLTWKVEDL